MYFDEGNPLSVLPITTYNYVFKMLTMLPVLTQSQVHLGPAQNLHGRFWKEALLWAYFGIQLHPKDNRQLKCYNRTCHEG